ncbi:MAG: VOC family protein, partial [Betaproteobacteria bacterium]
MHQWSPFRAFRPGLGGASGAARQGVHPSCFGSQFILATAAWKTRQPSPWLAGEAECPNAPFRRRTMTGKPPARATVQPLRATHRAVPASRGVHHLALNTEDMKLTIDFYTRVLGMPLVHALR